MPHFFLYKPLPHPETHPHQVDSLSRRAVLVGLCNAAVIRKLVAEQFVERPEKKSVVMTGFVPQQHGFHFSNRFVNVILDMSGIHLTTAGRCGGMAYTALDYYFARRPVPQYKHVPECERDKISPASYPPAAYSLVHYIFYRQLDTMRGIWPVGRASDFFFYTLASDHDLFDKTIGNEADKLIHWLRAGMPVPLGLIGVRDVRRIGENHQVVSYGYEVDPSTRTLSRIHIYDPNHPDQQVTLSINKTKQCLEASTGRTWRGFFVRDDYSPCVPPMQ